MLELFAGPPLYPILRMVGVDKFGAILPLD